MKGRSLPPVTLDSGLIDAVRSGRAVLFLGAGASLGARNAAGRLIPGAPELTKRITSEFLGPGYDELDFKTAYDLAASHRSVRELQAFLHRELHDYQPADFHLLMPTFVWAGLVTTNYDLIVERAYEKTKQAAQKILTSCKDDDGATDQLGPGRVLYVKLHGCITRYQDINPPLLASTEQIINHREGRAGQFAQFLEWAKTKTIIFAGYGLADGNLRAIVDEIRKEGDNRPRHYIVRPGIKEIEEKYWGERRFETINGTYEQFLDALDNTIRPEMRRVVLAAAAFSTSSFARFIARSDASESTRLRHYLEAQCEHVSQETAVPGGDPKRFYNGFDLGWYPFAHDLDIARRVTHALLQEQIITTSVVARPRFAVVKAHAGGGKSVVLRRVAWNAARQLDRLVFFFQHASVIDVEAIEEIVALTNQTVYLIIDNITEVAEDIFRLLGRARARRWPIVVIGGARFNEWNVRCEGLELYLDQEYEIGYLSHLEIDELLARLALHNCLGHLEPLSMDDRRKALREVYGRQLLVALHEATKNATFREIIRDEYKHIIPAEAQILYLDICALHRFGPPVRAGLIARVHGVAFEEFKSRFFKPLEQIVDVKWDTRSGDWTYRARHSYIAAMVYEEILSSVDERFDNMMRIVGKLNPAYSYDREVLAQLIRAGNLADIFKDRLKGEAVYEAALRSVGRESFILQQWGIYEMRLGEDSGTLDRAERLLTEALELAPNNRAIQHSLAELSLARSKVARDEIERDSWRRQAESQAQALANAGQNSYAHHTLAKAAIAAVRDGLEKTEGSDDELSQEALSQAIKHAEDVLKNGLQLFPNDDRLLGEEAELGKILRNADRALRALERAFKINPRSELIARRLGRVLRAKDRLRDAIDVLRQALEQNPGSQSLHYDLAQAVREEKPDADTVQNETLLYHLRRSFAPGDRNHEAQFWYARQLCLAGQPTEALKIFTNLRELHLPFRQKQSSRGIVLDHEGKPLVFYGQIYARQPSFGFIRSDENGLEMYFSVASDDEAADALRVAQRVSYNLAFNLLGPLAQNVTPLLL